MVCEYEPVCVKLTLKVRLLMGRKKEKEGKKMGRGVGWLYKFCQAMTEWRRARRR